MIVSNSSNLVNVGEKHPPSAPPCPRCGRPDDVQRCSIQEGTADPLKEWLELGREVLGRYFPNTRYAVLVAEQDEGMPSVALPVIPLSSSERKEVQDA